MKEPDRHDPAGHGGDAAADGAEHRAAVRPYVLTGGRAAPGPGVTVDTLLTMTAPDAGPPVEAGPQQRALLRVCRHGVLSVGEAAAHLRLPVSVTRVLAEALADAGHLRAHGGSRIAPDMDVLREVLRGLRNLR